MWLAVLADKQIHLDPFARTLFVHGQSKCAQRAALQTHAHDSGVASFLRHAAGQQREIFRVVRRYQCRSACGLGLTVLDGFNLCGCGQTRIRG